jgi:signal transduction histidine kinase
MTQPSGIVLVDPTRLRQVVDNLISNAVKFSPPGSLIKVYARQQEAGWWIGVQDSGPGITSEDRQRLFQDFSPLSAKPTAREKSIGLGLSIARQVVEAHGGQIGVDSEPGQGATFWFILPPQHPG